MHIDELPTPALVVDRDVLEANIALMGQRWPGRSLRPHVKAFKSVSMARRLAELGHDSFCAATIKELAGLAAGGLGGDLLLANETVDLQRLKTLLTEHQDARITVAVDSPETVSVAAQAGIKEVLIDINVGMPRCGCAPEDAGPLGDLVRSAGMTVRGVMGYEGHLMTESTAQGEKVEEAMGLLLKAHDAVGGEVISGGGTGTWRTNRWVNELQAGSFTLMDTDYEASGTGFSKAISLRCTIISVNRKGGWAVADGGTKALGLDHGLPSIDDGEVLYCSDEHTIFAMKDAVALPNVGERVSLWPSHVDPTVSQHDNMWLCDGDEVVERWAVELRGW